MTLEKAIYYAMIVVWLAGLLVGLAMLIAVGYAIYTDSKINIFPFTTTTIALFWLRYPLAMWLNRLGELPGENLHR